jgi:hypothetical protein
MSSTALPEKHPWPLWRKVLFRFFFIYLIFQIAPWTWLDAIPAVTYVTKYYYQLMDWAVKTANANIFHVRKVLVPFNGSGDTSYGWAQVWLLLSLAVIGCIVWSVLDRKRNDYRKLNYWLCLFTRYFVASVALNYGILKLFALQMPFPSLTMLATPLGDLLPMRLSWMFIGYSAPYQVFSGIMEVLTGLLLLNRRTATLGIMFGTAVFVNVMVLNLTYDIPVKLFSMHIVLMCLFLLANEYNRIACFLFLNRTAIPCNLYDHNFQKRWMRITRIILKIAFILLFVGYTFYNYYDYYKETISVKEVKPIRPGLYDVPVYVVNNDTVPPLLTDSLRWQDIIFEKGGRGSIKTSDTAYRQIYRRAYFYYKTDTLKKLINISRTAADTAFILSMHYQLPDSSTIRLWGVRNNDSIYIELRKSKRHFQLAEKQFHWLSEYNR